MFQFGMHQESAQETEEIEKLEKGEREIKARFPAAQVFQKSACYNHMIVCLGGIEVTITAGLNGGYVADARNSSDYAFCPATFTATATSATAALDKARAMLALHNAAAA